MAEPDPTDGDPHHRDPLHVYRLRRDLSTSPEPYDEGHAPAPDQTRMVVHKHDASTLHYDLRLEADGVLKSWAVPKGPSMEAGEKRLAIRVEDHPLSYGEFEGVIPEGLYGAGAVILWDEGTYEMVTDEDWGHESEQAREMHVVHALEEGKIDLRFNGDKLHGEFRMVRMDSDDDQEKWLLTKLDDEYADPEEDPLETRPRSVRSGLTLEELEEGGHQTGDDAVDVLP